MNQPSEFIYYRRRNKTIFREYFETMHHFKHRVISRIMTIDCNRFFLSNPELLNLLTSVSALLCGLGTAGMSALAIFD